ncbi:glycosyltransferase [Nocardioides panacisoli]|uniref:glycosyltransferase n=1 Tax=Nocardioides panacisoli TaxID=627624 RepID=UPI001C634918|nr:glycosyltransferase [Nocardioides panacisoli]QYJ04395.1 glycosyltransferase [Nocardioides panacisoli]
MSTRLLQRQILPLDRDLDVVPLYVDVEDAVLDADKYSVGGSRAAKELNHAAMRQSTTTGRQFHPDQIESRTALRVPAQEHLSLGTYFNAFPASYWRRHTIVDAVTLTITVRGRGASVVVHKSMAAGHSQRVGSAETGEDDGGTFTFDLTLKPFVDGGWYWYDVLAGDEDVVVESAEWTAEVPEDRLAHGTVDVAITTMNRPDFCAKLLGQIAEDEGLRPYLDTVFVMEQGTDKVVDSTHFDAARDALGDTLQVLEQGNLGGSGGYARGQLESLRKGTATYALMMDDDVVCEPEGIIRAVTFGDLAKRPSIVGGHMFNIYSRSRLHSFGEVVKSWRFWWQSAPGVLQDWDFGARNLRSTRWLHRRIDVDYNGWFMCLIPRQVIAEIGLSLPLFLKWDDSEYGLRAREAGYPTVTFPGAAVWHVPWTDKNDAVDWQSYFHHRNRLVAALLHSPYPRGGRMVRESMYHQIMHLVSMQYSTAELRLRAMEEVLAGPEGLHDTLPTKLGEVREFVKQFPDAQLATEREAFPPVRRRKPSRKDETDVPSRSAQLVSAALMPLRQVRKPRPLSREYPEAEVAAMDAKWYRLGRFDSAVVSMNDGTSAAMYQRRPEQFRELMRRSTELHQQLLREWPRLAAEYRAQLSDVTSPEAWERTLAPWLPGGGADE